MLLTGPQSRTLERDDWSLADRVPLFSFMQGHVVGARTTKQLPPAARTPPQNS